MKVLLNLTEIKCIDMYRRVLFCLKNPTRVVFCITRDLDADLPIPECITNVDLSQRTVGGAIVIHTYFVRHRVPTPGRDRYPT